MSMMEYKRKALCELKPEEFSLFAKTVSETDAVLFAGMSGNYDPVYMNQQYAEETEYGGRIIDPMLLAAMAGGAVFRLLSPGAVCVRREWETLRTLASGSTVTVRAEVESVDEEASEVTVLLECYDDRKELVMRGRSVERITFPAAAGAAGQEPGEKEAQA